MKPGSVSKLTPPDAPAALEQYWRELAANDARRAYLASWQLARAPREAVALLAARVGRIEPVPVGDLERWVEQLNDDRFQIREGATKKLAGLGVRAEAQMRRAFHDTKQVEVGKRLHELLQLLEPVSLRTVRAVWVLSRIPSQEATSLLEKLAAGAADAPATIAAKRALRCRASR